eukprot:gene9748-9906_t
MHFGPALSVVSGNYVAAKRRGIIDGVDFGFTGEVRFIAKDSILDQLDIGNIVLLSNLGFTAAGEVLNCNTYDVGLHASIELGADKLICLHLNDVTDMDLPQAHLVDARLDGGILLELYSRDGVGTMISTDFYEGIRKAAPSDLEAVQALLEPLERNGVLVRRSTEELRQQLSNFTVIERETKPQQQRLFLERPDTGRCEFVVVVVVGGGGGGGACELGRGTGRGDSLLDYVEQDARRKGMDRLVLLTTRTADWFMQRDFKLAGAAWCSDLVPSQRRNSQLYVKELQPLTEGESQEPGSRIGF